MWPFEPIILYGQFGIVVNPVEVLRLAGVDGSRAILAELLKWSLGAPTKGFDGSSTGYCYSSTIIATFDVSYFDNYNSQPQS